VRLTVDLQHQVASLALVDTNVAFIVENGGIGKIVSAIQLFAKEDSDVR